MTTHTDFAAPVPHDPWHGVAAIRTGGAPSAPVDTTSVPPSLALHARLVALGPDGAPLPGSADAIDRTLHPSSPAAIVEHRFAVAPLPGTMRATAHDPWRPLQHLPSPAPEAPARPASFGPGIGLDAAHAAAQLATLANSRGRLDRARTYTGRTGAHAAEVRAKLTSASERQVSAAIGTAASDPADLGPLRGEAVEVDRLHRQALAILADVQAEHARHEADAATLFGSDGAARAKLADAHAGRALAQTAVDAAKALLDRAAAHAAAVDGKLGAARAEEARHDGEATARLRAALANGDAPPAAAEAFTRTSPGLEDDLRHARAAVDNLMAEHVARTADLTAADLVVKGAVDGVLCAEAEAVARELDAMDSRALALRTRLHCYATRRAGDWVRPPLAAPKVMPGGWFAADPSALALPPAIRATGVISAVLASAPPPPSTGPFSTNWTAETGAWDSYAAALAADPQAEAGFAVGPISPPAPPLPVRAA